MLSFLLHSKHFQSSSKVENYTMNPHPSPYSNMEFLPHLFHLSFLYSSTFSWLKYLKENSRHIIPDIWAFSDATTSLSQATNEHLDSRVVMLCPDPSLRGGLVVPVPVRAACRQPRAARGDYLSCTETLRPRCVAFPCVACSQRLTHARSSALALLAQHGTALRATPAPG